MLHLTTMTHTTLCRTPLYEWSARRRDLYFTTYNTHDSHAPEGFEPAIPASERPQTDPLDSAATGISLDIQEGISLATESTLAAWRNLGDRLIRLLAIYSFNGSW